MPPAILEIGSHIIGLSGEFQRRFDRPALELSKQGMLAQRRPSPTPLVHSLHARGACTMHTDVKKTGVVERERESHSTIR